jgi:hypothetical protein
MKHVLIADLTPSQASAVEALVRVTKRYDAAWSYVTRQRCGGIPTSLLRELRQARRRVAFLLGVEEDCDVDVADEAVYCTW